MRLYTLNIYPQFADPIFGKQRNFDVRENTAGFQTGDLIRYNCIDGEGKTIEHPINNLTYQITYLLSGWGISEGNVVFSLQQLPEDASNSSESDSSASSIPEIDDAS